MLLKEQMKVEEAEKVDSLLDMLEDEDQFLKVEEVRGTDHTAPPSGVTLVSRSSTFPV